MARMEILGLVERANLGGPAGVIVWGTYEAPGQARPNIYRQTIRHEIAVSAVSARYVTAGFPWRRDDRPQYVGGIRPMASQSDDVRQSWSRLN